MKLYEIIISPGSPFGTDLRGDTLFGHFCWQAAHDPELLNGGLDPWVQCYPEKPALIFSSAYPRFAGDEGCYALRRPDWPGAWEEPPESVLDKRKLLEQRKQNKAKSWILVDADLRIDLARLRPVDGETIAERILEENFDRHDRPRPLADAGAFVVGYKQMHNTINRLSGTTGEGAFAPFEESACCFLPGTRFAVFVLIDPQATDIGRVAEAMRRIGRWGYGKNASTGHGRFQVEKCLEHRLPEPGDKVGCYMLGPCVPKKGEFAEFFYTPFVRFGKHGDRLAHSGNPFKNPVLMAEEGAVGIPAEQAVLARPYVGRAVTGTSKALAATVAQGYSIYIPITLEDGYETGL